VDAEANVHLLPPSLGVIMGLLYMVAEEGEGIFGEQEARYLEVFV